MYDFYVARPLLTEVAFYFHSLKISKYEKMHDERKNQIANYTNIHILQTILQKSGQTLIFWGTSAPEGKSSCLCFSPWLQSQSLHHCDLPSIFMRGLFFSWIMDSASKFAPVDCNSYYSCALMVWCEAFRR